ELGISYCTMAPRNAPVRMGDHEDVVRSELPICPGHPLLRALQPNTVFKKAELRFPRTLCANVSRTESAKTARTS
ncbi:hypothetical protein M407DRAFT_243366, partial [Tulasnella calospora MUT 4182]